VGEQFSIDPINRAIAAHTCNTCGGTSTPMVGKDVGGTGLGGAAAGLCCCKLCRNSACRLSCSCSCSRINCSFNCVRDVGVAVLNVGGLKKADNIFYTLDFISKIL